MKRRGIFLLSVLLGLLGTSWFAAHTNMKLRAQTDAVNRERSNQEAALKRAIQRRETALDQRAAAEKELTSLQQQPSAEHSNKPVAAGRVPTIAERLRTEPDAQVLWLNLRHAQARATYGPLFRKLELTQEQIAKFEDNLTRKEERELDLQAITAEQLKTAGKITAELDTARRNNGMEYDAAQRALLGDAGFQELQEQQRTSWARQWVDGWAGGAIVYLGEPLTAEQGEALIHIIANASDSYRQGNAVAGAIDWSAVDTAAQRLLTPNQFKLFTTMEPPLPNGGRFQSQLYEKIGTAVAIETKPGPR
jgi:hypothetical protein